MHSLTTIKLALERLGKRLPHRNISAACAFVFAAFFLIIWFSSSKMGVATSPDSASYLSTATSLRYHFSLEEYRGATEPHYPPVYSAMLASVALLTFRDTRYGSPRLVAAISFGFLGLLTFMILQSVTASMMYASLGCAAVVSCKALVEVGVHAMSEMPFMVLSIAGAILLSKWSIDRRVIYLIFSAIFFALACATRYVGIVWPAAAILLLLADSSESSVQMRLRNATWFGLIAYAPLCLWTVYWLLAGHTIGGGVLQWHPIQPDLLLSAAREIGEGIGMQSGQLAWVLFAGMLILVVSRLSLSSQFRLPAVPLMLQRGFSPFTLLTVFLISYLSFLIASISLFNRATPLDWRILAPATWIFIVLFILLLNRFVGAARHIHILICVVGITFFYTRFLYEVVPRISHWSIEGHGLSHYSIQNDQVLSWIRNEVSADTTIMSNTPWIVYLTSQRDVMALPIKEGYTSGAINLNYDRELLEVKDRMNSGRYLILMDTEYSDPYMLTPSVAEIEKLGLKRVKGLGSDRFFIYE